MVRKFNKFYKSRGKDRSQARDMMRSVRLVVIEIATTVERPNTFPMSARLPTNEEKSHLEDEAQEMSHLGAREGEEMLTINKDAHG